ncbi:hypothetical protein [Streptomyces sp. NBC_00328]|uniref:hypothetical protein n=1 Tax=Streptomyces sp. NBC_00328 TaxID=2903646 RepID=UPI002E2C03B5|nr:hypothetical protein [Streptomyces sp. NBC_00328]
MSDHDDHESAAATPAPNELAKFYLDTLENLMDPAEYADLRTLFFTLLGEMAEPITADDPPSERRLDIDLNPAVLDEWLTVMGILGSGRMDQTIVEVGDGSRTVVDSELAAEPEALAAFCAQVRERNRVREQEREILKGIEASST